MESVTGYAKNSVLKDKMDNLTNTGHRLISAFNLLIYTRFTKSVSSFFCDLSCTYPLYSKVIARFPAIPQNYFYPPDYSQSINY